MQTFAVYVDNKPGVLNRVASLFRRRAFNIESLTVGHTELKGLSRMTIVVEGDDRTLEQIKKQLNKLIDVISVTDFTKKDHLDRELVILKVNCSPKIKPKLQAAVKKCRGVLVNCKGNSAVVEGVGDQEQIKALLSALEGFGIKELVRTGRVAISY